jgi:hypothetical protein
MDPVVTQQIEAIADTSVRRMAYAKVENRYKKVFRKYVADGYRDTVWHEEGSQRFFLRERH